ncbi:multiple epidermal growth factor-like domains protein 10 [Magallana gigas]|uniref:multiple epidermal growth factor-like domains protein 10 n=1 Tax=Magallana gigas TaxID=29159 RepID=UPI00334151C0
MCSRHFVQIANVVVCISLSGVCNAYVNLALHKPAFQSNSNQAKEDISVANYVVDGLKTDPSLDGGQCATTTLGKQTSTWWVDLTSIHSIHHITIYFMTMTKGLDNHHEIASSYLGFSVYVSNTTDKQQGVLCFKDNGFNESTKPAVFTTKCTVHGRYVIYNNEKLAGIENPDRNSAYVMNNLCEVEVYGCQTAGYYGADCSSPCPHVNCQHCHIETGTCQGCMPGYQGQRCQLDCERGWYGVNCNKTCGHCRHMDQCSNTNGTCLTGCDAGFQGELCNTTCETGWYGEDCKETCEQCRDLDQCSHINGTCLTGCRAGFHGDFCNITCEFGYYGIGCRQKCSAFCETSFDCNTVTGQCNGGCMDGWEGPKCLKLSMFTIDAHKWKMEFYGMFCIVALFLMIFGIMVSYCVLTRFSKKDVLIQHDYNDTEETGSGGISTLSEIDVSCYYYREVDESNDIDMSITNPAYEIEQYDERVELE